MMVEARKEYPAEEKMWRQFLNLDWRAPVT
jgi:hypothetical protein